MSEEEWLERYSAELGVAPPSPTERDALLAMAGLAAHASVRTAAPISCWLAARAGVSAERAKEIAAHLATEGDKED